MGDAGEDEIWYPTVDDIRLIHEDIIKEDPDATAGVYDESRIEYALDFIRGRIGKPPETIHEKAFHLMRLIASNHWFADGNKRTALNATELFYLMNGYELTYGDDLRSMLKLFSVREDLVDKSVGPEYLRDKTAAVKLEAEDIGPWDALALLLVALVIRYSDDISEGQLDDIDIESVREEFGLTTEYGTTVNIDDDEQVNNNGG